MNDLMRRNGLDRCAFVVIFALIGSEYDGSREGGCATSRVGTGKGSHRPKSGGVRGVGAKTALPAVRALVSWASVRGPGTEAQQPLRPTTLLATKKARDRTGN